MFSAIQSITRSVLFPGCTGNNKKEESYTATHFSKSLSDWERSALPGEERCRAAAVIRDCLAGKKQN